MKAKRKLPPPLRKRRDGQAAALMMSAHGVLAHAIKNLFDGGMEVSDVAFYLSQMENAAGRAITSHVATNGEVDDATGFWTVDSVFACLPPDALEEYGRHLADAIRNEHKPSTTPGEVTV